jgi:hypothetical protein
VAGLTSRSPFAIQMLSRPVFGPEEALQSTKT